CSSPVKRGDVIGTAGAKGAKGQVHLHLSVYYNGNLVDPYGWQGQYQDPLPIANSNLWSASKNLWKPKAYADCDVRWHPAGPLIQACVSFCKRFSRAGISMERQTTRQCCGSQPS